MSEYKVTSETMTGTGAYRIVAWRVNDSSPTFNSEEDAESAIEFLEAETAPLHETIATLQAALDEQSQALALARQNADAEMELFKRDEATIRELQERNARLLDMVNTKEAEKVELRKTIAQRDELLRTQGATLARYQQFAQVVQAYADEGNLIYLGILARGALNTVSETDTASAEAPTLLTGVPMFIHKRITRKGEAMAFFRVNGKTCVIPPPSWPHYEQVIEAACNTGSELNFVVSGMEWGVSIIESVGGNKP